MGHLPCASPGSRGVTLLELLVVLALLGLLATLALPHWEGMIRHHRLVQAVQTLALDLIRTRERAWIRGETQWMDLQPEVGTYQTPLGRYTLPPGIRFGTTPGVLGPPSHPAPLQDPDGVTFPGNRIRFDPEGTASPGTLYLTNGEATRALTLTLTGRVRLWQWQDGAWQ